MLNRIERIVSLFASGTYALMTQFGGGDNNKKLTPSLSPLDRKKQEATTGNYTRGKFPGGPRRCFPEKEIGGAN